MKQVAAFDFDGTLIHGDSFILFGMYARGRCRFVWAMLKAVPWLLAWKTGLIKGGTAKERLFGFLYKGMPRERFAELGRRFASTLSKREKPETLAALREALRRGNTYIVSASVREWVEPWAEGLGGVKVICTEAESDSQGCLTGRFATPNCAGAEKVRRLREMETALDECELTAYGDSSGDDELLAIASWPHRVTGK